MDVTVDSNKRSNNNNGGDDSDGGGGGSGGGSGGGRTSRPKKILKFTSDPMDFEGQTMLCWTASPSANNY